MFFFVFQRDKDYNLHVYSADKKHTKKQIISQLDSDRKEVQANMPTGKRKGDVESTKFDLVLRPETVSFVSLHKTCYVGVDAKPFLP